MPLHIVPVAAGGDSAEENLWLACPLCNGYKSVQTHATDRSDVEEGGLALTLEDDVEAVHGRPVGLLALRD